MFYSVAEADSFILEIMEEEEHLWHFLFSAKLARGRASKNSLGTRKGKETKEIPGIPNWASHSLHL